jgi:hypothetical protein
VRKLLGLAFLVVIVLSVSGCAVNLPFNTRADYDSILKAKALSIEKNPIAVKWVPVNFPERVDIKGASGFVGRGSMTRIPIGAAISKRVIELLDVTCGVDQSSRRILTVDVIDANPEFEYSANIFNLTPGMDVGRCTFEAEFTYGDIQWRKKYTASYEDYQVGAKSQTGVLETAFDDIALQVVNDIAQNIFGKGK